MEEISILLQDPKYDTPNMIPENLDALMTVLILKVSSSQNHWLLPGYKDTVFYIAT